MNKLSRYNSLQALKSRSKNKPSTPTVVGERHEKFEHFINTLKAASMGSNVSQLASEAKSQQEGHGVQ